jgi:hypothetical protein
MLMAAMMKKSNQYINPERRKYLRERIAMRKFLMDKGFKAETLALLTEENLAILAKEYGYKK